MDWNIQSRAHVCGECAKGFGDREPLHTLLFSGAEAFERLDVCVKCWESQFAEGANHRRGFISHWQTVHLAPQKEPEPIQRASAEILLRQLLERNDPAYEAACFVLAVMLERKRLLKAQGRSTDGGRQVLHYEHAKSGDVLHVTDPALQLDQLESVQRQVATLLEQGLPPKSEAHASQTCPTSPTGQTSEEAPTGPSTA